MNPPPSKPPARYTLRQKLQITGAVLLFIAATLAFILFALDFTYFLIGLGGIASLALIGGLLLQGKWPPLRE